MMQQFAVELQQVSKTYHGDQRKNTDVKAVKAIDLAIKPGEFFTLLGPSGCGKTTLLRLIAGFETATSGHIFVQGKRINDVPAYHRPINTVFQNYALFPHLTVAQNVSFGLDIKGVSRAERDQRVQEALQLVQLPGLGHRKPSQLSGGQQQRVALARAIVNRPAVLLLDEPLGALDLKLRKAMQVELKHLQSQLGMTFIYVTHDQEEALAMSDRIAVMCDGHLLQVDDPFTIYEKPSTRFVADFIGESNFLDGVIRVVENGQVQVDLSGGEQMLATQNGHILAAGQGVTLAIRPEKLALQPLNGEVNLPMLKGVIRDVIYLGTDTRYTVELASHAPLIIRTQNVRGNQGRKFMVGDAVKIEWLSEDIHVLDRSA